MTPIDAYLADLDRVLCGPRRKKADLLTEARDSLADAAEVYQSSGVERASAERTAVTEFGAVREIAPQYQQLLGYAQARRTALLVFFVSAVQSIGTTIAFQDAGLGWQTMPAHGYVVFAHAVDWLGLTIEILAVAAALACGIGTRYLGTHRWLPRAIGLFAVVVGVFFLVAGWVLSTADHTRPFLDGYYLAGLVLGGLVPFSCFLFTARSCLRAS